MKITTTSTLQQHRCDGTSLIEVLVTLVILSIGLLGLAALQLNGLRSNTSAALRTASTLIAGDIIERMRANPTAVTDGLFSNVNTADVGSVNCGALPNPYCSEYYDGTGNVVSQPCNTTQMAQFDLNVWYCGAANGGSPSGRSGGFDDKIPNGNSTITCIDNNMADAFPCTPGSSHVINVNWQEIAPDGTPTAQRVSITFVP